MRTIALSACLAAGLAGGSAGGAGPVETGLQEGQLFPPLLLPGLPDGKLRSTSDLLRGRKTLLIAFASW